MSFLSHDTADMVRYRSMNSDELQQSFLLSSLFALDQVNLILVGSLDRALIGSAVPTSKQLELPNPPELKSANVCQRRELGAINLGGPGRVMIDSQEFLLEKHDALYVGKGAETLRFTSDNEKSPARFYLLSFPAHTTYPTTLVTKEAANRVELGSDEEANRRTIFQYIHEEGVRSCQLVMGWTELASGSVWNTMPPHTHDRRSEVYLYYDLPEDHRVLHMMGEPHETRPLWVKSEQAVLSPPWSIHCGCGTSSYSFVWGMGGENQRFDDMDLAPVSRLR